MDIPKILSEHIREGQIVLFLGSGASIGAVHPQNTRPPAGQELSNMIAEKFLGAKFRNRPLSQVAELAISEADLFTVQDFIASSLRDFHPSDFHKLIPKFVWSAIATTNFDLVVERAYDQVTSALQRPVVFKKNGERIEEKLKSLDSVIYLKLHGCITDINDPAVPLILTPEQYVTHRKGRSRLFERLESLAYEYPLLFVGHSLGDPDIRAILLELNELGEAKPRSYIVAPNITPAETRFWESRKFSCIQMSFEDFLNQLDYSIPNQFRVLVTLPEREEHPISRRFAVSTEVKPSQGLMTLLNRDVEYLYKGYKTTHTDPQAFYKGYFVDWSPIIDDLDVKRSMSDGIMSEVFLATEEEKATRQEFYLIKGHAGSGKSVLLKRLAWDASIEYDRLCLSLRPSAYPEYEPLSELFRLCQKRIFLFADPVTEYMDTIEDFMIRARQDKLPLTIIGGERHHEWNTECEHLEAYLTDSYEVRYLSEKEIEALIDLLTRHKSLGHLEGMRLEEQKSALSKRAGRQLLVALHEATLGKPFSDIVLDEYKSITSRPAQSLYLTVCILHRLGVATRAGLISRVHGVPFSKFKEQLFAPLEFIVFASKHGLIRDYVYRSRHPHIAEIVFERVLVSSQDRFDEYLRIINALDVDYNTDREAFKGLTKARSLISLFRDPQMIRQLYTVAKTRSSEDPMLMQQEAIFEMTAPGGSIDKATGLLQRAYKIAPYNKAIAHSLAELALKKADRASTILEKSKLRRESREIALRILSKGSLSAYSYHTVIKIGLDELSELMEHGDESAIDRKIKEIEDSITKASQRFPDNSFIFEAEARFCKLINDNPKALDSLKKAFSINKRSPYIAIRLARMYEYNDDPENGLRILKECLEANPSDKSVNFRVAMLLGKIPSANKAEIKHYLRRSFTEGDTNYEAQFWYARFVYMEREHEPALEVFRKLGEAHIDSRIKKEPRGVVKENNRPVRFTGTVSNIEASYGFIIREGLNDRIFTHVRYSEPTQWQKLKPNRRVSFELGFNYRGPFAINVRGEGEVV